MCMSVKMGVRFCVCIYVCVCACVFTSLCAFGWVSVREENMCKWRGSECMSENDRKRVYTGKRGKEINVG